MENVILKFYIFVIGLFIKSEDLKRGYDWKIHIKI